MPMLHHLRTWSLQIPQTFFISLQYSTRAPHLLADNVSYKMSVLRKPFIFILRHKLAYEQDSSLTATSKGPKEQVNRKRALRPCYTAETDARSPNSTSYFFLTEVLLLLIEILSENLCMCLRYRYRYVNQYLHKDLCTPQAKTGLFD